LKRVALGKTVSTSDCKWLRWTVDSECHIAQNRSRGQFMSADTKEIQCQCDTASQA
jgi:hypothetical protein